MNLNYFKVVEATGLKLLNRGPPEWHHLHTKFHENLPSALQLASSSVCHDIIAFILFFPYTKLHALAAIVTLAKDCL
jgi:hypothetical protein